MAARVQAVYLAVGHVRQPGKRVPIAGIAALEGPNQPRPGQPGSHVWIFSDVLRIIEGDELMTGHRPEAGQRDEAKQQANADDFFGRILILPPWSERGLSSPQRGGIPYRPRTGGSRDGYRALLRTGKSALRWQCSDALDHLARLGVHWT